MESLVAPYRAILRYYRCDTPYRAILSQPSQQSPNRVRYPPLVPSFTQTYQCDTPFCNISRDTCAIPPGKQARKCFAILSLKVSRDMKSIAAGPLRWKGGYLLPGVSTVDAEKMTKTLVAKNPRPLLFPEIPLKFP